MSLQHAQPGEPISLRPYGPNLGGQVTHALFKSTQLEVIRIVLMAGKEFTGHAMPGDITIQCLEGRIRYSDAHTLSLMSPGAMLYVPAGVPHTLIALDDASLLMTISL